MKRGLTLGKFMPLHNGHIALIDFARSHCDELTVLVCSVDNEPIPGHIRLQWLHDTYNGTPGMRIFPVHENSLPVSSEPDPSIARVWAEHIRTHFGRFDVCFTSEAYGINLARELGCEHRSFDAARSTVPISATAIRERPFTNWDYIAPAAKPYFVKKVCIYGAESTGKTTLTEALARHFRTSFVPEMARVHLGERHCVFEDMEAIAKLQTAAVARKTAEARCVLFCDTDVTTTCIYSERYFGRTANAVTDLALAESYDLYLFLEIDVPWVADIQRDSGHIHAEMRDRFAAALDVRGIAYHTISGDWKERGSKAIELVNLHLFSGK